MPTVSPTLILIFALVLSAVPAGLALVYRTRERRRLRALAAEVGCDYRPDSDETLARRLGPKLPAVGAAAVRVTDVFARPADAAGRRLVLRVDYSLGSVRHRRNNTRVVACEVSDAGEVRGVRLAPLGLPRLDQFRQLLG